MNYQNKCVSDLRIAYIGGGSRGWARGLMSDLVSAEDISGTVALYDIDMQAARDNAVIGEKFNDAEGAKSHWSYVACTTLAEALTGADFVVISILPGTFDEMESDVHAPEQYGIYQSVGDTTGPGGIVRALRTVPMFQVIAEAIRDHCPDAWVINYTNPMTVCIRTLYKTFPGIKAFGCCHEVFGTQKLLASAYADQFGGEAPFRREIKVNVIGVNHFTWVTSAQYRNVDLFPVYAEMAQKYAETGYTKGKDDNWMNNTFDYNQRVKFDLFNRYGCIAAAGDRHLAEFCPGKWYLESPEQVKAWGFGLTTVRWRKNDLANRRQKTADILSGKEKVVLRRTGEEGVSQMRALLGLHTMITNVNMPNKGQIPNLPLGAVVETNAVFSSNHVTPCMAGPVPMAIYGLIAPIVAEQENLVEAAFRRDLEGAFAAFVNDPLVTINMTDARTLFDQMIDNTKAYLSEYFR